MKHIITSGHSLIADDKCYKVLREFTTMRNDQNARTLNRTEHIRMNVKLLKLVLDEAYQMNLNLLILIECVLKVNWAI